MKITDIAIRKAITIFALMAIVVILGVNSYIGLPREAAPDVKIPFVMVYAPYYGTSSGDMENLVTRKLEQQLKGLSDLEEMTSSSSEGVSTVVLEFTTDVDMSDALQKVRDAVELAKPELPQDVKDDLIVMELSSEDWPIMTIVLSGDYDLVKLKKVAEDLQKELEQVQGVLSVDLAGGIERQVRVDVNPERLRFYDLGLNDVMDAIALENVTIPGGDIGIGTYDYQVRVPGEFKSIDEILDIVINPGAPTPVYMRDVAEVSFGTKDRDNISRLNQHDAVSLAVKKRSGENVIRIADEIHAKIEELKPTFPATTQVSVIADHAVYIRDMVTELENNILSGLILVVAVLFLFLGWTNSFFVGLAIPFSMLISFTVLRALGVTLNMVVLFSLILALGMLVDNAIVIVENIYRHRRMGMDQATAASAATHQVSAAVIASTLTTVCAFAPLVFWPGIMGEFMKYLPITVIVTLSSSLLVALVFNPVLCARFMRVPETEGRPRVGDRLLAFGLRTYEPTIRWALRHKALILAAMVVVLVVTTGLFGAFNAGVELFPDSDPTYAYVSIDASSGTRIEVSDTYARRAEAEVDKVPDLKDYVAEVGTGGGGMWGSQQGPSHLSVVTMEFIKREYRSGSSRKALEDLRHSLSDFTGGTLTIEKEENGPPTGPPVSVEISGDDFAVLGRLADEVKARIRDIPGLVNLMDDYDRGRPEIQVRPDRDKAGRLGLRVMDVASTVRTAIRGQDVGKYRIGEDEYDIVVRFNQPSRRSAEDLEELTVFYEGQNIPLTAFADVRYGTGLGAINRIDSERVVTVSGDVASGYNSNAVLAQVQKTLSTFALPRGYHIDFTGENEEQNKAQAFLSDAFGIAIMLILVVLITQFGSITTPFVIISSVILSLIGVFIGLLVTHTAFGIIMTGVGVISLAGIVVNNAIVLIDYVIKLRDSGKEKLEAIVEAGLTRFRPVILTAVTTILGLIPLTTGFSIDFERLFAGHLQHVVIIGSESSEWWGPMGVAVIWGLSIATFLTLVVVPVMYASLDPIKAFFRLILFDFWAQMLRRRAQAPAAGAAGTSVD